MNDRHSRHPLQVVVTLTAAATVVAAALLLRGDLGREPTVEPAQPRRVSAAEFCAAYEKINVAHAANLGSPSVETTQELKGAAAELSTLVDGTAMSDAAKAGTWFITTLLIELDDVATSEEIAAFDDQASLEDAANARALGEYVADACVPAAPSDPK